jgi:hypothetical protein
MSADHGYPEECIWETQRPAHGRTLVVAWIFGLCFLAVSIWIVPRLMHDRSSVGYATGAGIGVLLCTVTLLQVLRGSRCCVDLEGDVWYGFGRHPCLRFPLNAVRHLRMIEAGALIGIGVEIDPSVVTILHRKGVSYAKMREWQRRCGCALVLEFFEDEDRRSLAHLRRQFLAEIGSTPRPPSLQADLTRA